MPEGTAFPAAARELQKRELGCVGRPRGLFATAWEAKRGGSTMIRYHSPWIGLPVLSVAALLLAAGPIWAQRGGGGHGGAGHGGGGSAGARAGSFSSGGHASSFSGSHSSGHAS